MTGPAIEPGLVHHRGKRPGKPAPVDVVTVQSQVAYGHAGNSAAVEPLLGLGLRVVEVPTTLLSNAPIYPTTRGRVLPAEWLADLLLGIEERGVHERARAVLTGYLGTLANGLALAAWMDRVRGACPGLRLCLDPVLGDTSIGDYVESGLADVYLDRLLAHAWLVTPNEYELRRLVGRECREEADYLRAARELLAAGPEWVVVHGIAQPDGTLRTLAVGAQDCCRIDSPRLDIDVTGTGDVFAALLCGLLLRGLAMPDALERTVHGVHRALEATLVDGYEELEVAVAAPAALQAGRPRFGVTSVPAARGARP